MERGDGEESEEENSSHQNTTWKQFQAKVKPIFSPKLGAIDADVKKENTGMWMFRKKKKNTQVLDRIISSSQPDLVCSSVPAVFDGEKSPLCGEETPGSGRGSRREERTRQPGAQKLVTGRGSDKPTLSSLVQSHHKSSSLGSACLEQLVALDSSREPADNHVPQGIGVSQKTPPSPRKLPAQRTPPISGMYRLEVVLKRGHNLAIRDRAGTSDPYVKFKLYGKEVFRSKIIHKNLNPVWDEDTTLLVDDLTQPLYVKVFDYDFGRQDDFMGSAYLNLESLEQQRALPVMLVLSDPRHQDQELGCLELSVTLSPKLSPLEEPRDAASMLLRRSWRRSSKQQSQRFLDARRRSQLWSGIVSIALIEGRDLLPMDSNGLSDPYVKFRLGHQKYRSKTKPKTLSPQWREQFDLNLFEETGGLLEISVWDRDRARDDFIGRCQLNLSTLEKEKTHRLELPLEAEEWRDRPRGEESPGGMEEEPRGSVLLLVTLTASSHASISDLALTPLDNLQSRCALVRQYGVLRSFTQLRDVGIVQIKVLRAEGLRATDIVGLGRSDPFCLLELNNDRLQTHTVYKNLNPEWNKVFTFNVKDIHSVLEVSVFDEDRTTSADFLGKVIIPLLQIRNGEQKAYVLKNKDLNGPSKGVIHLEAEVIYNKMKAGIRTFLPAEQKYIEDEPKVSKQLLQQNYNRVKRCIMVLVNGGIYINSCFEWESPCRSLGALLVFVVVVWNFQPYMLPLGLCLLLGWNCHFSAGVDDADMPMDAMFEWEEEEEESDYKDSEHKGFIDKLSVLHDVCVNVQNTLGEVASIGERVKNVCNWTVPFLSWLAVFALCGATVLLYLVPLRYLVLAWGVNKFTRKLRDPYIIGNNELLDFLSRVPSKIQVIQYRELKVDSGQSPTKRRRNNPG